MRRADRCVFLLCLAALLAALVAGCASDPTTGYVADSPFPADVRTIAVPILENGTLVRDIEFELTDALIKEIQARTPYAIADTGQADTVLVGQVRHVELDQLSKSRQTGLGEEVILAVTIDFQWRDQRTGRSLVERASFTGHSLFVPSTPTGERIELGRMAVVQQLARDIVDEMRTAW